MAAITRGRQVTEHEIYVFLRFGEGGGGYEDAVVGGDHGGVEELDNGGTHWTGWPAGVGNSIGATRRTS